MQFEDIFPFLFPIFFIGLWVVVSFLLAVIGGWSRLAEHYQAQTDFSGTSPALGGHSPTAETG